MMHNKMYKLVLAALFAALTFVATNLIHIPIPATNGYINLGDCVVLLGACLLGPAYGAAAGGVGAALADILSGYGIYAPGTFLIKGAVAAAAALLLRGLSKKTKTAPLLSGIGAELVMIFGYFGYESTVLGYGLAAAGSIPGNAVQAVAGVALSVVLYEAVKKVPAVRQAVCESEKQGETNI